MRSVLILLTVFVGVVASSRAPASAQAPALPDLRGYVPVSPDAFAAGGEAYFQTPDGLLCAILPDRGVAGCDGELPGAPDGVEEIALTADPTTRGLRATAEHDFVKSTGDAAPVLREGQKIVFGDFACAVGAGAFTACTKGQPVAQWMVLSPSATGIGPGTEGLPSGFPDPNDLIVGDDAYVVGLGGKNGLPTFTVDGGLTCSMMQSSSGEIGCDGTLPGSAGGENEVFTRLPGPTATRHADVPTFRGSAYPGLIERLPVGHRVNDAGSTCMAITGGVACLGAVAGVMQGFKVTASEVSTFGG